MVDIVFEMSHNSYVNVLTIVIWWLTLKIKATMHIILHTQNRQRIYEFTIINCYYINTVLIASCNNYKYHK